jgi:hypothetical protein
MNCIQSWKKHQEITKIAQSFKHNQTWQVCLPGLSWVTNLSPSSKKHGDWIISYLCYFLLAFWSHWNSQLGDKFVSLVWAGRQTCRPSHIWLCLKDWAYVPVGNKLCQSINGLFAQSERMCRTTKKIGLILSVPSVSYDSKFTLYCKISLAQFSWKLKSGHLCT